MSANKSFLQDSALYYTALEHMFDDLDLNRSTSSDTNSGTPGFKCFARHAQHCSSANREPSISGPKRAESAAPQPNEAGERSSNERNISNIAYISTPKRSRVLIRQQKLFKTQLAKIALSTRPPTRVELSPRSKERKRALERYEQNRQMELKKANSKKPTRIYIRV